MSEEQSQGSDIALELGGQKVNVKNVKSLNTLATIATLIIVVLIGYGGYLHIHDTREASKAFIDAIKEQTGAIKEQTVVQRENNCLQIFKDVEQCRRIVR
jgi:hypothetical protein